MSATLLLVLLFSFSPASLKAAPLAAELKLTVVFTIPNQLSQAGSVEGNATSITLEGNQPLMVVFSRPVIALGADFGLSSMPPSLVPFEIRLDLGGIMPGKLRWVTTYLARFDPDGTWPPDLSAQFVINENLTSYDGVDVDWGEMAPSVALSTSPLAMWVGSVVSSEARRITDGHWNSRMEVPPGGHIEIVFSHNVSMPMISESLQLVHPVQGVLPAELSVMGCRNPDRPWEHEHHNSTRCVSVRVVTPELEVGQAYKLQLPVGAVYNGLGSGPLRSDTGVDITGLNPFIIKLMDGGQVGSRRLNLALPHGLSNRSTMLPLLETTIKFFDQQTNAALNFTLSSQDRALFTVHIPKLMPTHNYKVSVPASANITDGFELPLQQSSAVITARAGDSLLLGFCLNTDNGDTPWYIPRSAIYSGAWDGRWPIVVRGDGPPNNMNPGTELKGWSMDLSSDKQVKQVLGAMSSYDSSGTKRFKFNTTSIKLPEHQPTPKVEYLAIAPDALIKADGMFLQLGSPDFMMQHLMVVATDVGVIARKIALLDRIDVWVTSLETGAPVVGATVTLWQKTAFDSPVFNKTSNVTSDDGVVHFYFVRDYQIPAWLEVAYEDKGVQRKVLAGSISFNPSQFDYATNLYGELVVDRAVVKAGDKLLFKGYIRELNGDDLEPPGSLDPYLYCSNCFQQTGGSGAATVWNLSAVDTVFGTFDAEVMVPEDAEPGPTNIQLCDGSIEGGGYNCMVQLAVVSVVVADPRPRTVFVNMAGPEYVKPEEELQLVAVVGSYIGAAIAGAELEIKWSTTDARGKEQRMQAFKVVTNETGMVLITFPATHLRFSQNSGDGGDGGFSVDNALRSKITATAVYIGPTGERIEQQTTASVRPSGLILSIQRSIVTDIPFVEFLVAINATNATTSQSIPELAVEVHLSREGADEAYDTCTSRTGIGYNEQCGFQLPDVGRYKLTACVHFPNDTSCGELGLGKTQKEWESHPLNSFPQLTPHLTPPNVADDSWEQFGGNASVQIDFPYAQGHALLLWGNARTMDVNVVKLQQGLQEILLPVGSWCTGECRIDVTMTVGQQNVSDSLLPTAPLAANDWRLQVSPYFDPRAPQVVSTSLVFQILDVQRRIPEGTLQVLPQANDTTALDAIPDITASSVSPSGVVLEPGSEASLQLEFPPELTKDAEVTFFVVDQAYLDIKPVNDPVLAQVFGRSWPTEVEEYNTLDTTLQTPDAIPKLLKAALKYLEEDPWTQLTLQLPIPGDVSTRLPERPAASQPFYQDNWLTEPDYSQYGYEQPAQAYVSRGVRLLSVGNVTSMGNSTSNSSDPRRDLRQLMMPPGPSQNASTDVGTDGRIREEEMFKVTAVFATVLTVQRVAKMNFFVPEKLGKFSVRAFAVTEDGKFGQYETAFVVRKPLSLVSSVPRFVRVGDTFQAGVVITATDDSAAGQAKAIRLRVLLSSDKMNVLSIAGLDSTVILLQPMEPYTATFNFTANGLGKASLEFEAEDDEYNIDRLGVEFEVVGVQDQVYIGTSFVLDGAQDGNGQQWQEGLQLPEAIPDSGTLDLSAGIGFLGTQTVIAQMIAAQEPKETNYITYDWALSTVGVYAVLSMYQTGSVPNATMTAAQDVAELGSTSLSDLTAPRRGLAYSYWTAFAFYTTPPDFYINAIATWLSDQLIALVPDGTGGAVVLGMIDDHDKQLWKEAAARAVVRDAHEMHKYGEMAELDIAVLAHMTLGASWEPSQQQVEKMRLTEAEDIKYALSMKRVNASLEQMSVFGLAGVALMGTTQCGSVSAASADDDSAAPETIQRAMVLLQNRVRIQGRTAYLAVCAGCSTPAGVGDQSLGLLAFLRTNTMSGSQLLPKLSAYIAQSISPPRAGEYYYANGNPIEIAMAALSLQEYDMREGNSAPNVTLTVSNGEGVLVETTFDSPADTLVENAIPFEALDAPNVTFSTSGGSGQVAVAVGVMFVPAKVMDFPVYAGLSVERVIQAVDARSGAAVGPPLNQVPLHSQCAISVQIMTPDNLGAVMVRVLMPGGLEPVDPNLASDVKSPCEQLIPDDTSTQTDTSYGQSYAPTYDTSYDDQSYYASLPWYYAMWQCPRQLTTPAVVELYYSQLPAGVHSATFFAVAATAGNWSLPAVKAYVLQQPEVMGLSAGGTVSVVCENCTAAGTSAEGSVALACPDACKGQGICDVRAGRCLCFEGFSGDYCGDGGGTPVQA